MHYQTRNMIADAAFRYAGRELRPGETFAATPVDAGYLTRHGKAHDAPSALDGSLAGAPAGPAETGGASVLVRDEVVVPGSSATDIAGMPGGADEGGSVDDKEGVLHLLDLSVAKITPQLEALPLDALQTLRAAEQAGKTRTSMIAVLDDAIAKKAA
jgi:hypothetical protein